MRSVLLAGIASLALASCAAYQVDDPEMGVMTEEPAEVEGDPATALEEVNFAALRCPAVAKCGGRQVDKCTDPKNCGACGRKCKSGAFCRSGACVRPQPDGGARG